MVKGTDPILCRIDSIEVIDATEKVDHPYRLEEI